jgi:hypothetical protein
MKARSCLKSTDFSSHTTPFLILQRTTVGKKLRGLGGKLVKQYQAMFLNVTATILTGTVFLGGSYLFFIQLAEYGW